jgi:hypothetical protein|tara:strand:+ start:1486 stop:2001 length:516 start_codon:yes stop_codon:yes gene_type:complete
MINRVIAWGILLGYFVLISYREEIIAAQTIFCAANLEKIYPFHFATIAIMVITDSDQTENEILRVILLHCAVCFAVAVEYLLPRQKYIAWTAVVWIVKWLNCTPLLQSPFRACLKCCIYIIVSNLRQKYLEANYGKCIWILLVNEIFLILVPFQLLHEIYYKKKKESYFIV